MHRMLSESKCNQLPLDTNRRLTAYLDRTYGNFECRPRTKSNYSKFLNMWENFYCFSEEWSLIVGNESFTAVHSLVQRWGGAWNYSLINGRDISRTKGFSDGSRK